MNPQVSLRDAVYVALWAALVAGWAAASVLPGLDAGVRAHLDLEMADVSPPSIDVVAALAVHNASIALWPLAGIAIDLHNSRLARLLDIFLAATLAGNAAIIGMALSAYGARLLPFLPHLPLELLGLALPAAAWAAGRRGASPARVGAIAWQTVGVLLLASVVEAYGT